METSEHTAQTTGASDTALWFGLFGGAVAWLLHLILAWGIAEFGCVSRFHESKWLGLTAVAWAGLVMNLSMLALAGMSLWVSQRNDHHLHQLSTAENQPSADSRQFIARSGVLANWVFVFIIVVQSLPFLFYLGNC
jgi:hypothetical protein